MHVAAQFWNEAVTALAHSPPLLVSAPSAGPCGQACRGTLSALCRPATIMRKTCAIRRAAVQVFNWLPLAAHVENKILCMHGGIGRSINRIKQIEVLYRPLTMEQGGVVLMDLLWSDPTTNDAVQVCRQYLCGRCWQHAALVLPLRRPHMAFTVLLHACVLV